MKAHPFPADLVTGIVEDMPGDPGRIPELLSVVQADLALRLEEYRETGECAYEDDDLVGFIVPRGHWESIADRLGFAAVDTAAARTAHERYLAVLLETAPDGTSSDGPVVDQPCVVIEKPD